VAESSDDLETLRSVIGLREIASLIERTARWVSPDTFKLLPLWFPEHARRGSFYKGSRSEPQMNKNRETGNSVRLAALRVLECSVHDQDDGKPGHCEISEKQSQEHDQAGGR
jgi:hypothetical protein